MPNIKSESRRESTRRSDRIEELVGRIEGCEDLATRTVARELLHKIIELHGVALERIVEAIAALPQGRSALDSLAEDEFVSDVLSLHNIHAVPSVARVERVTKPLRPYLEPRDSDVALASIQDGTVHVFLHGTCGTSSSSMETLKQTVEPAIYSVAPEIFSAVGESSPKPRPVPVTLQTH